MCIKLEQQQQVDDVCNELKGCKQREWRWFEPFLSFANICNIQQEASPSHTCFGISQFFEFLPQSFIQCSCRQPVLQLFFRISYTFCILNQVLLLGACKTFSLHLCSWGDIQPSKMQQNWQTQTSFKKWGRLHSQKQDINEKVSLVFCRHQWFLLPVSSVSRFHIS